MTFEPVEGGRYFIHVDQDTLSVYVSWQLNDVIRIDDEEPYTFYRFPRENRLTQVTYPDGTQTLYQYNKKNNMVSTTTITETATETTDMTYDIENRLLQSGATLYEYDNNGNMIAGSTAYRYYSTYLDGYKVNWLVGVGTTGGGPINPTSSNGNTIMSAPAETTADTTPATSYGYALDGRRIGKAGAVDMKYLYDGENVVYELWDDMTVRFTHPVKSGSCGSCGSCGNTGSIFFTDHPISMTIYDENGIPTKYYYLYDGLGSVTELIDASENVVNYYRYTPFGDALIRQETIYNSHQYTGRQYDAESGLYHYRARAYSADMGRFMQNDPAGMVDGPNMYAYVGNNPVNNKDPGGMKLVLNSEKCMNCISNVLLDAMGESTYNSAVMAASCIMGHLSAEVVLFLFGTGALSFEPTIVANTQGTSVVVGSAAVAGFITMIALCIPLAFAVTAWKEILNCGASSLTYNELQDYSTYYTIITTLPTSEHFSPSYSYISPISIAWVYNNYNPKEPYSLR